MISSRRNKYVRSENLGPCCLVPMSIRRNSEISEKTPVDKDSKEYASVHTWDFSLNHYNDYISLHHNKIYYV